MKTKIILLMLFIGLLLVPTTSAMKSPDWYVSNYDKAWCEIIAKDLQKEFGGNLILLVPLLRNGEPAYLNDNKLITGHMINRIYMKGNNKYFYIDYGHQRIFDSKEETTEWYLNMTSNMLARKIGIYDINNGEHPPIPMIWRT